METKEIIETKFDIRELMNYNEIRRKLISYPTELSLFELSCILINNKINEKKDDNNDNNDNNDDVESILNI